MPAVLASVYQYEGQLQVVRADRGGSCLRCQWPEATRDGLVGNCAEAGVLGPVPAVLGQLQAMEVLKLLLDLPGQLQDELLLVDLLVHGQRRLAAPRNPGCAGRCVAHRRGAGNRQRRRIDVALPLAAAVAAGYRIVDIREPMECEFEPLPVARPAVAAARAALLDGALAVDAGAPVPARLRARRAQPRGRGIPARARPRQRLVAGGRASPRRMKGRNEGRRPERRLIQNANWSGGISISERAPAPIASRCASARGRMRWK